MDDKTLLDHIQSLVEEEQKLLADEQGDAGDSDSLADDRLHRERISVELDRCWDLLRQRRARREASQNPDEAHERDANTVERYLQ